MAPALLWGLLLQIHYVGLLKQLKPPGTFSALGSILAGIFCGGLGNGWCLAHARKAIVEVRGQWLSEGASLRDLTGRGWANLAASLGFSLVYMASGVAMVVLVRARLQ